MYRSPWLMDHDSSWVDPKVGTHFVPSSRNLAGEGCGWNTVKGRVKSHETLHSFYCFHTWVASITRNQHNNLWVHCVSDFPTLQTINSSFNWIEAGFQSLVILVLCASPFPYQETSLLTTSMASLVGHVFKQHWETRLIKEHWTNNTVVKQRWETTEARLENPSSCNLVGEVMKEKLWHLCFACLYVCIRIYGFTIILFAYTLIHCFTHDIVYNTRTRWNLILTPKLMDVMKLCVSFFQFLQVYPNCGRLCSAGRIWKMGHGGNQ